MSLFSLISLLPPVVMPICLWLLLRVDFQVAPRLPQHVGLHPRHLPSHSMAEKRRRHTACRSWSSSASSTTPCRGTLWYRWWCPLRPTRKRSSTTPSCARWIPVVVGERRDEMRLYFILIFIYATHNRSVRLFTASIGFHALLLGYGCIRSPSSNRSSRDSNPKPITMLSKRITTELTGPPSRCGICDGFDAESLISMNGWNRWYRSRMFPTRIWYYVLQQQESAVNYLQPMPFVQADFRFFRSTLDGMELKRYKCVH